MTRSVWLLPGWLAMLVAAPLVLLFGALIAPRSFPGFSEPPQWISPRASEASQPVASRPAADETVIVLPPIANVEPALTESPSVSIEQSAKDAEAASQKLLIELRGRINADAIWVTQSERDKEIIGDVENATGFRRARLGAQGFVGEQVNWVAEFDFATGLISFKDVYIGVNELPIVRRVRVGHFREPFSLEGATSANVFTFVERSPINVLDPGRNWGVGIFSYSDSERLTFAAGAFRSGSNNSTGGEVNDGNDMAYTMRATVLPWYEADGARLLHLGTAFSTRFPKNDEVMINQGPQNNLLSSSDNPGSPFLPAIIVPANQQQLYNLEAALVLGPLSFQAEWSATTINQIGGDTVFLHGCYAFVSFFLTGEHREYLTKDGEFGITKVRSPFLCLKNNQGIAGGPGAWEVTARFAYADFASASIPPLANGLKVGDRDAEFTAGLNWYLNDNARVMFNYVHSVPVDPNFGPSWAEAFFLRTAIFW